MYRRRRVRLSTRYRPVPKLLVGGSAVNATDQTPYSFANLALPYGPDRQRVVYAWILNRLAGLTTANALPSSVTIGGITAILLEQTTSAISNTIVVSLYAAIVPTGDTATVAVTFPATQTRCGCFVASTIAPRLKPSFSGTLAAATTNPISGDVFVPKTGFLGVVAQDNVTAQPLAFSGAGATEVVDSTVEGGTQMGAATLSNSGTLGISSTSDAGMIAAWLAW